MDGDKDIGPMKSGKKWWNVNSFISTFFFLFTCRIKWLLLMANLIYTMPTFCQPMRLSIIYCFITQTQMFQVVFMMKHFANLHSHRKEFVVCVRCDIMHFRWLSLKLSKVSFELERVITFHDLFRTPSEPNNMVRVESPAVWKWKTMIAINGGWC